MTDAQGDKSGKSPEAYRTIGEVSEMLGVAQHVLRFWESRFSQIKPVKRAGNRRYYRPDVIALIRRIRALLHDEGYSIRGVQKLLKSSGVKDLIGGAAGSTPVAPAATPAGSTPAAPASTAPAPAGNQDELRGVLGELREIRDLLR